jgi:tRNA(Ile)-lysidine synthetase-like protein
MTLKKKLKDFSHIYLGFSGGIDSTVLAHMLKEEGIPFTALYFNHNWSSYGTKAENFCIQTCKQQNIPLTTESWASPVKKEKQSRNARLNFFKKHLKGETPVLLQAHHKNDHVETILQQILRGTKLLPGLRTHKCVHGIQIFRPLLGMTKKDILGYADSHNLVCCPDPTNTDPNIATRNKIRNQILPQMDKIYPDCGKQIERLSSHISEIEDFLQSTLPETTQKLSVQTIKTLHPAQAKAYIVKWLKQEEISNISDQLIQTILGDLIYDFEKAKINLPKGKFCRRKAGELFIQ